MKICNRDYPTGSLKTVEDIRGVPSCPNCKKPTALHNSSVEKRVASWALSDDTGTSSKTLCRFMAGLQGTGRGYESPPADADDRGRCIRLLELIPEWIERLPEIAKFYDKPSEGIVISSSGIRHDTNTWATQIPLILKEGSL